jgi:DNA recombination protein RmuC
MNYLAYLAAVLVIFLILVLVFGLLYLNKQINQLKTPSDDKSLLLIQQQLNQVNELLSKSQIESSRTIQEQHRATTTIIKDVVEKLANIENTNKQVVGVTEQLQGLEYILKNPKQRGILGEYYLESLLKNLFQPNQYKMQYQFSNGEIVDAAIFVKDKILPIDSKFSLENYNKIVEEKDSVKREQLQKLFKQDLKNRIDETAKYIRPKEGTMDFAFMFIPSEGIYYDLLVNQIGAIKVNTRDLIEYAFKEKRVIIVSPTSFAAYLQTVLQGLRALKIEDSIKDIVNNINKLNTHLLAYQSYFEKLGNSLSTTVNNYNSARKEFLKIDKDITKITGEGIDCEILELEKPVGELD